MTRYFQFYLYIILGIAKIAFFFEYSDKNLNTFTNNTSTQPRTSLYHNHKHLIHTPLRTFHNPIHRPSSPPDHSPPFVHQNPPFSTPSPTKTKTQPNHLSYRILTATWQLLDSTLIALCSIFHSPHPSSPYYNISHPHNQYTIITQPSPSVFAISPTLSTDISTNALHIALLKKSHKGQIRQSKMCVLLYYEF